MDDRQRDIDQHRLFAALSYLWILCFVPLLCRRHSKFAMHHARQGLVLLIAESFNMLILWFIPFFGYFISMFLGAILIILAFFGIINALDGKYWQMPLLGKHAKKIRI